MTFDNQQKAWIERRIRIHNLWLILILIAWVVSIVGAVLLFTAIIPAIQETVSIPDFVIMVTAGGVVFELFIMLLITVIVTNNRRRLQNEHDRFNEG